MSVVLCGLSALFLAAAVKVSPSPRVRYYLIGFSLFFSLAVAEELAQIFFIRSDSFGFTLAAKEWRNRYWHPINSHGFRDREWPEPNSRKRIVTVVGDSFVAGSGVDLIDDRFPEQTAQLLGSEWRSVILAQPGWGPRMEYEALVNYTLPASVIALSYFINDIEDVFPQCGRTVSFDIDDPPPGAIALLERNSYLVNFLYWRLWRFRHSELGTAYWNGITEAFDNNECVRLHFAQLRGLIKIALNKADRVVIVIFPDLADPARSTEITRSVAEVAANERVPVIDVTNMTQNWKLDDRVVNAVDSHPSLKVHRQVAQTLARWIDGQPQEICHEQATCERPEDPSYRRTDGR